MSITSKLTLFACTAVSVSIIGYVHIKQQFDRERMHEGVVRDVERRKEKKIQNLYLLTQQQELARELKNTSKFEDKEHNILPTANVAPN